MMPWSELGLFVAASAALAAAPGPDNLYTLSQSALHGRRAGFVFILGLCTGLQVHIAALALGVAALLAAWPLGFHLLRILGAAYLLYLAWQAWYASAPPAVAEATRPTAAQPPKQRRPNWALLRSLYRRGIIMNLSNPKVGLFFLAFLPPFARPEWGNMAAQLAVLGWVFMLVAASILCAIAWAADGLGPWLAARPQAERRLQQTTALVMAALALRLLWG